MEQPEPSSGKLKGLKVVSLLTLLSRITGLARDGLMASLFGTGWILDAFTIAFRIPNMFRRLFGEGALTAAFLPEFVRVDETEGRAAAVALFSGVAGRMLRILATFVVGGELLIASLYLVAEMSDRSMLLCELSLILLPYLLLICMAGLYSAALNGVKHFVVPAVAPIVLNLIWLGGGLLAAKQLAAGDDEVRIISAFIVIGGMVQLSMVIYQGRKFGITLTGRSVEAAENTTRVFRAMGPVLFGLSITQINGLVDSLLAWGLSSGNLEGVDSMARFRLPIGTAGALYLGQRLFQFPLGVFAVALGTVLFPRFAKHAQTGNHSELNKDVIHGLQLVLAGGIPASIGLWFMAAPITDLLFRYGQFDAHAASMTKDMIAGYGLGVWVFSGLLIVNRVFYAANDQITPMRQGLICVGLNLLFDFVLLPILGGPALPIASVLATLFQLGLALEVLRKRFLSLGREAFVPLLWRVCSATLLMNLTGLGVLYLTSQIDVSHDTFIYRAAKVFIPMTAAVVVYVGTLLATGLSPKALLNEPFGITDSGDR
jgi:putative peptidoglycan lipid II flippase